MFFKNSSSKEQSCWQSISLDKAEQNKKFRKLMMPFSNGIGGIFFRIIATILFVIVVNRSIDKDVFGRLLCSVKWSGCMVALISGVLGLWLQIFRWNDVLKSQGLPSGIYHAGKTMLFGNLLAFLTPGRMGELFRGIGLDPHKKAVSVLAVATDRFFAISVTLLTGLFSALAQVVLFKNKSPQEYLLPVLIIVFLIPTTFILVKKYRIHLKELPLVKSRISALKTYVSGLIRLPIKRILLLSVAIHLLLLVQTAILLQMFGSPGILKNIIIAGQAYAFMIFLPFFIANIGLREYSFTMFLKITGDSGMQITAPTIAFGVSGMVLLMNIILPALIGLFWIVLERKRSEHIILPEQENCESQCVQG